MQENNRTISDFIKRTDELSARKGLNLSEIPEIVGISKAMLYAYRNGKNRITNKVWLRLEAAEGEAGVAAQSKNAGSYGNPKDAGIGNSAQPGYGGSAAGHDSLCPVCRMIPVIGWAHAGEAENYEPLPESWQCKIPTECRDVKAFAVSLEGDSMEPKFSEGDLLIVQPSETAHSGCLVVARFVTDGVVFRRLEMAGKAITLVPLNPRYETSQHTAEEFSWIYPVWGRWSQIWRG